MSNQPKVNTPIGSNTSSVSNLKKPNETNNKLKTPNNTLNKIINNIEKESTPNTSVKPDNSALKPANTSGTSSKINITGNKNTSSESKNKNNNKNENNNNNNDNNDNNNNNSKSSKNNSKNNLKELLGNEQNKNSNSNNNNKPKEEENILSQGAEKIGNTISNALSDIKNKIMTTTNNKKNNSNLNKSKNENENENNKNENNKRENNITNIKKSFNNSSTEEESGKSMLWFIVKVVIMILVLIAIFYIAKYLINRYQNASANTPYLLSSSKNAMHALVISQDSTSVNYIPINKSDGQDGIQFTYGFWFLIEDFDYKKDEWKHIFHKGNSSSYPNRAPGVWIHPNKNAVRVYMNTLDNILEYVDVDNLPSRKWIYMNIILNNKNLDLYINGYLKIRKELSSIPKQNDGDFWVNMFGGFNGYVSNIRYYSYAIDFNEINKMINAGPSINNCIDTGEIPPYLDDNWWFGYDATS